MFLLFIANNLKMFCSRAKTEELEEKQQVWEPLTLCRLCRAGTCWGDEEDH